MDALLQSLRTLWSEALGIWASGGWAMWPIAVIAFSMFFVGMHVWNGLQATGFGSVPEDEWRDWIERPNERDGRIGEMLDFVLDGEVRSDADLVRAFDQVRASASAPFERDLLVMKVCIGAAPLVGLLGTVTGMLTTFGALSSGSGGDKTMAMIADGIAEALITTETGLVVAIPGMFFRYQLTRKLDQYRAFLAHVETVCTQTLHRRNGLARRSGLRRGAFAQVARHLFDRVRAETAHVRPRVESRGKAPLATHEAS
ncbi:MAG: MotA/TolQ/ExbB proton channel family protein [Planctomycetota bacterium]